MPPKTLRLSTGRFTPAAFRTRIIGVKRVVAEVFIGGSMKIVGAALRDDLNIAAARAPNVAS